jgi:hypothetical protein
MATVDQILDRALAIGTEKASLANNAATTAINAAQGIATLTAPHVGAAPAVMEPNVFIPSVASGVDTALYGATYAQIIADLSDKFAGFFSDYFPMDGQLMPAVLQWLEKAVTTGGSGINTSVEDKIWQRDRDRITRLSLSEERAATASWAAKGYPLPPGAAHASVMEIRRRHSMALASLSRDRAIKTFEQEIENVKFAIQQAIDYRMRAVAAAGDYIRALALAPQIASQLATSSASAQATLINAAASYYSQRIKVAELKFSSEKMNAEMALTAGVKSLDGFITRINTQASTAIAIAQSLGQQASAALNAVNGTAQIIKTES